MARLNITVHVTDADGAPHVFGPGQDVPDWAAKAITNPHVWEEPPSPASRTAEGGGPVPQPPPRSGAGSGTEAWARYATDSGVEVRDGAGREEIIEALQAAGVPVDQPEE